MRERGREGGGREEREREVSECVCVRERERGKEEGGETGRERERERD